MNELFKQVKCSERLPKKSGEYLTAHGLMDYDAEEESFWFGTHCPDQQPVYWLEPIAMPSEEEIKLNIPYPRSRSSQMWKNIGFIRGAKWIINQLNQQP